MVIYTVGWGASGRLGNMDYGHREVLREHRVVLHVGSFGRSLDCEWYRIMLGLGK